ncbi:MAG: prepilin-type N-terminal cleavage/methylation domain-containing protein [Lentimonas sp.]|jgi:prepilin-type N-terminal cleavage/methylation domain-containing protein
MNINKNTSKRSGFTLIELLTVIAIIGILAGILLPVIGVVRKSAAKATAASNLRQIATAYVIFAEGGPRPRAISNGAWASGTTSASDIQEWAQVVAQFGSLNEAPLYFVSADPAVANIGVLPSTVLINATAGTPPVPTGLKAPAANWTANVASISYAAITEINPIARSTITPLIWTKGIIPGNSTWLPAAPWGDEGGHIAFLDTHVTFYNTLAGELSEQDGTVANNLTAVIISAGSIAANIAAD